MSMLNFNLMNNVSGTPDGIGFLLQVDCSGVALESEEGAAGAAIIVDKQARIWLKFPGYKKDPTTYHLMDRDDVKTIMKFYGYPDSHKDWILKLHSSLEKGERNAKG